MTNTARVNTHSLIEGNVVCYYGCRFKLTNRKNHGMRAGDNPTTQGDCITFKTIPMEEYDPAKHAMPRHWYNDWTIQGNGMAFWNVELDD